MGALPDGFCEGPEEHRYTEFDCPETASRRFLVGVLETRDLLCCVHDS